MPLKVNRRVIEAPQAATYLLLLANCAVFVVCTAVAHTGWFSTAAMLEWGAVSNDTLAGHHYWRLLAAGFLHFNALHLLTNMICLVSWGGALEKRAGTAYFFLIYMAAAVGGNVVSVLGHHSAFVGAGASGAIWGIVGALVCLQLLGKPVMPWASLAGIIVINVALNAARSLNIDWMAHAGGFVTGVVVCGVLNLTARVNRVWLRCKFPEFVKLNLAVALPVGIWLAWPLMAGLGPGEIALVVGVGCVAVVKLFDFVLGQRKGLALAAFLLSAGNFGLVAWAVAGWGGACGMVRSEVVGRFDWGERVAAAVCGHAALAPLVLGVVVAGVTLMLTSVHWQRGLADVGFIPERMRADRVRATGL